jgi:hypothetical protein
MTIDDHSFKALASFCVVGLLVSLCLVGAGMDLTAGWL